MATLQICDRCGGSGPLEPVRSKAICASCTSLLDQWLTVEVQVARSGSGRVLNREDQALHFIRKHGHVTARMVAALNDEPYRVSYHGLRTVEKRGVLKNIGHGQFVKADSVMPTADERGERAFQDAILMHEVGGVPLRDVARLASAYHKVRKWTVFARLRGHFKYDRKPERRGRYLEREAAA